MNSLTQIDSIVAYASLGSKLQKRRRRKGAKKDKKTKNSKEIGHFLIQNLDFCICPRKNVSNLDASGKKGMLSFCKCLFE